MNANLFCHAISHAVSMFSDGTIAPCCHIDRQFSVPITELTNPNRFDTIYKNREMACRRCLFDEQQGFTSYRSNFNGINISERDNFVWIDVQNTNLCNLHCRICNPTNSDKIGKLLGIQNPLNEAELFEYYDQLVTDDLQFVYFTGGEPMLNIAHWDILDRLVASGQSKNVSLIYSTNCTLSTYKDRDVANLWPHFAGVLIRGSVDAVGPTFEAIRPGVPWHRVERQIQKYQKLSEEYEHIDFIIQANLSRLNVLHIHDTIRYLEFLGVKKIDLYIMRHNDRNDLIKLAPEFKPIAIELMKKTLGLTAIADIKPQLEVAIDLLQPEDGGEYGFY